MSEVFRFLLDHDGVQADSLYPVIQAANPILRRHGLRHPLRPCDFTGWTYLLDTALKVTGDPQKADKINNLWFDPDTLRRSRPYRGVLFVMSLVNNLPGAETHTVTTRVPTTRRSTLDWYDQYLPWVAAQNRLHIRTPGYPFDGDRFKCETTAELEGKYFIDDNVDTINALRRSGFNNIGLITQPWNTDRRDLDPIRLHGWPHLLVNAMTCYYRFLHSSG